MAADNQSLESSVEYLRKVIRVLGEQNLTLTIEKLGAALDTASGLFKSVAEAEGKAARLGVSIEAKHKELAQIVDSCVKQQDELGRESKQLEARRDATWREAQEKQQILITVTEQLEAKNSENLQLQESNESLKGQNAALARSIQEKQVQEASLEGAINRLREIAKRTRETALSLNIEG